ncbi:MAG: thiamine diphosphokinase [Clostridiales Family XIII bacterium]|nr:thiamine diphosphokinase [Clostridiales Family XIII bacterium]
MKDTLSRFVIVPGSPAGSTPEPVASCIPGGLGEDDYICCADGGYARCVAEGIRPDIVIGDFDSADLEAVRAAGIATEVSPSDKDDTDTMLCVKHGVSLGFGRFTIAGGLGGEFSHTMANLQALSFLADMECCAEIVTWIPGQARDDSGLVRDDSERTRDDSGLARDDSERTRDDSGLVRDDRGLARDDSGLVRDDSERIRDDSGRARDDGGRFERLFMADGEAVRVGREPKPASPILFAGTPGAKFSVFSYAERSSGVVIQNAKYELNDAVLTQSYPVGVRNEFINEEAVTVSVRFGRLLIVAER